MVDKKKNARPSKPEDAYKGMDSSTEATDLDMEQEVWDDMMASATDEELDRVFNAFERAADETEMRKRRESEQQATEEESGPEKSSE